MASKVEISYKFSTLLFVTLHFLKFQLENERISLQILNLEGSIQWEILSRLARLAYIYNNKLKRLTIRIFSEIWSYTFVEC